MYVYPFWQHALPEPRPTSKPCEWPWKCTICGKTGTTSNPDPFTPHERSFRHRFISFFRGRSRPLGTR